MEVRWAPRAAKDLEDIFKRIERDNRRAARKVIQIVFDGCISLAEFPQRGRLGRIPGRRELVFSGLPYIAVYKVSDDAVEISRIWHGAQNRK